MTADGSASGPLKPPPSRKGICRVERVLVKTTEVGLGDDGVTVPPSRKMGDFQLRGEFDKDGREPIIDGEGFLFVCPAD